MIRAAVIAVLMLTAAITGAVAFDLYRPATVVSVARTPQDPDADYDQIKPREKHTRHTQRQKHVHKSHKSLLGKRYSGDDTANELNLRQLR